MGEFQAIGEIVPEVSSQAHVRRNSRRTTMPMPGGGWLRNRLRSSGNLPALPALPASAPPQPAVSHGSRLTARNAGFPPHSQKRSLPQREGGMACSEEKAGLPYACAVCRDAGWLRKPIGPEAWRSELVRCACQREADERRRAEKARHLSDLGQRHSGSTFANYDRARCASGHMAASSAQNWARAAAAAAAAADGDADSFANGLRWLLLWGDKGTGKTHLLAAAFHALIAEGRTPTPIYTVVPTLLDHIRGGYDNGDYGERFAMVKQAPILLLDDLGVEKRSDWSDEALFKLLDHRYRYELPTAVASNVPPCDLEARIASRLQDVMLSAVVELNGPDVRRVRRG